MKLYHCRDSRSLRALWTLEETGLPCAVEEVRFPPRVFQKEYLAINPLGTVPCLVDGDIRLTESVAICHYLVERYHRHDLGLRPEDPGYGAYLNWLYHSDATLTFPLTVALRYRHLEAPERRLAQAVDDYRDFFLGRLRLLEERVAEHEYLCDGRFTIADICVGYALYLGSLPLLDFADSYSPPVRAYLERLMARPAFQRAAARGTTLFG